MNTLKFTSSSESKVFFFSDLHIGHEKDFILNPRGFSSAQNAKDTLISNWNSKVSMNDTVFLLGDSVVGAGTSGYDIFNHLLYYLNYKVIYIMPGNHPSGFMQKFQQVYKMNGIDEYYRLSFRPSDHQDKLVHLIPNFFEVSINSQLVVLSHYPVFSWNHMSKGSFMIFGHCHNSLSKSDLGKQYLSGKVLDVGPESIGNSPISFEQVVSIMSKKGHLNIDHH